MATKIELDRLTFIKYLFQLGLEQSLKPEPAAQVSIFNFHDSVELFLALAAEHLQPTGKIQYEFMEYWENLKPKLRGQELSEKRAMARLNKARADFKHHGLLPSKQAIEEFRVTTSTFFKDNTRLVFGIDFDKLSLTSLISYKAAREELEQAENFMQQGKTGSALTRIGSAFDKVLEGFKADHDSMSGPSPFYFGEPMEGFSSYNLGLKNTKLGAFVDQAASAIFYMQRAIRLLSLGIDFRQYQRFRAYTTNVGPDSSGTGVDEAEYSMEECQFCFNFVIETALHMQQSDFEYDWYAHHLRHKGE